MAREGEDTEDANYFRDFNIRMDAMQDEMTRASGEMPTALTTDNNEPRRRGRPTASETSLRDEGEQIRRRLTIELSSQGMKRPLQHDMCYNSHGNIYMTS